MYRSKMIAILTSLGIAFAVVSPATANEQLDRQANALKADNYLAKRDFEGLERMALALRAENGKSLSGVPRVQVF